MSFEILDNINIPQVYDFHSTRKIIAYNSGNSILLWDLEIDKKIKLHQHETHV
jgi:hypothetical protein